MEHRCPIYETGIGLVISIRHVWHHHVRWVHTLVLVEVMSSATASVSLTRPIYGGVVSSFRLLPQGYATFHVNLVVSHTNGHNRYGATVLSSPLHPIVVS